MKTILDLINFYGSKKKLADVLHVSPPAVSQWVSNGGLPPARAIEIERITHGQFIAVEVVAPDERGEL
jgi:DNA-binding transcriptional regulator YdaS (Cro superfamily)